MKIFRIVLVFCSVLLFTGFCYATDSNIAEVVWPVNCIEFQNAVQSLTPAAKSDTQSAISSMDDVRKALFGKTTDMTITDFIVYVNKESNIYYGFSGNDIERGDKFPYLLNKEYMYVILVTDNDSLVNTFNAKTGKTSLKSELSDNVIDTSNAYVEFDSLCKYTSNGETAINLLAGALSKVTTPASSSNINQKNNLVFHPLSTTNSVSSAKPVTNAVTTECNDISKYNIAMVRIYFNRDSLNQLSVHFPSRFKEASSIFVRFGQRDTSWDHFGLSLAPVVVWNIPEIAKINGGLFYKWPAKAVGSTGDIRINGAEPDLMLHFYPWPQYPNIGIDSNSLGCWDFLKPIGIFVGVPVIGTSFPALHAGIGYRDFIIKDFGLTLGYGWNFASNNARNLILGLDFKLF